MAKSIHNGSTQLMVAFYCPTPQQKCISAVAFGQANGQARLYCQDMPLTTPSTNFSKECGKQQYKPLEQRIAGGISTDSNSWVNVSKDRRFSNFIILVFFFLVVQILLRGSGSMCGGTLINDHPVLAAAHSITSPIQIND